MPRFSPPPSPLPRSSPSPLRRDASATTQTFCAPARSPPENNARARRRRRPDGLIIPGRPDDPTQQSAWRRAQPTDAGRGLHSAASARAYRQARQSAAAPRSPTATPSPSVIRHRHQLIQRPQTDRGPRWGWTQRGGLVALVPRKSSRHAAGLVSAPDGRSAKAREQYDQPANAPIIDQAMAAIDGLEAASMSTSAP